MESYKTQSGEVRITLFGHASLCIEWHGKFIYADPYSKVRSYAGLPKADVFLITHDHYDHYDLDAIAELEKPDSVFIVSRSVVAADGRYRVLKNGDACVLFGGTEFEMSVQAVPAYNVKRHKPDGTLFHSKGDGNGYILTFDGLKVYVAGDTEQIPDMKYYPEVDIAFLPKDPTYTMTDEEFVTCANSFRPTYLYPYHYVKIDVPMLRRFLDTGVTLVVPPYIPAL